MSHRNLIVVRSAATTDRDEAAQGEQAGGAGRRDGDARDGEVDCCEMLRVEVDRKAIDIGQVNASADGGDGRGEGEVLLEGNTALGHRACDG
jgi:hypothetical protein